MNKLAHITFVPCICIKGVPQVVNGDPHAHEVLIVWETSAACKTSTSRRYSDESKCYHVHTYQDNGLRANLVDLTSLIRPQGYVVKSSDGTQIRVSVCKPLMASTEVNISSTCVGKMACAQRGNSHQEVVLGAWSEEDEDTKLHMHNGLLSVQYSQNTPNCTVGGSSEGRRLVRIHFICPKENQVLAVCVWGGDEIEINLAVVSVTLSCLSFSVCIT